MGEAKRRLAANEALISGQNPVWLANAVSDAIFGALERGMDIDEVVCIGAAVLADYGRAEYGDSYLSGIARAVMDRAGRPLPDAADRDSSND